MRTEFGISARELFVEMPLWEIDALLLARDQHRARGRR
jgi:hypothetical protein